MRCVSLETRGTGDIGCLAVERQRAEEEKEKDKAVEYQKATL